MNLLIIYSPEAHVSDISWAFAEKGHHVVPFDEWVTYIILDQSEKQRLYEKIKRNIKSNDIEVCFTWNYMPLLSDVCEEMGIPYLSWSFDSPILHIFAKNMYNKCNHFFVFDKRFYEELHSYHLPHVYYLPLAINSLRLRNLVITEEEIAHYKRDVSFVGNLYHNNLYDEWLKILPKDVTDQVEDVFYRQFNNWEEIYDYFEPNKDIVVYHSIEELKDQIAYYLSHEKERVTILANGYKKVHAEHTYIQRVEKMMETLK
ncbi:MAG TPA: DUF3880 domain-containing protein [Lachnospiraceae bacterium]|nr:DUF3880 domain-containing protein [Lachnospiraceae bacterium]